jgi:hypothetical protein
LDGELWALTPLGTVVPDGLLREAAHGGEWSYRPLLRTHHAPGRLDDHVARSVQLIDDRAGWDALGDEPEVAPHRPPGAPSRWIDERSVAVVIRDSRGQQFQGLVLAQLGADDPRLATVVVNWVWNAVFVEAARAQESLAAAWLTLFRALAARGAVGVRASEMMMGRRFVAHLRDIAGFRPGPEVLAELGLSPADAQQILCQWRATVEDDTVVRFGTRPDLAPDAHRQLVTMLAAEVGPGHRPDDTIEPVAGFRQTISGDVYLDGPHGTQSGPQPEDWFTAPPDEIPDGSDWMNRGRQVLSRWLDQQAHPT